MRILYINNEMAVGGVTKCMLNLVKNLKKEFNIVLASNGGELLSEFSDEGIKLYNINNIDDKSPINIIKNIKLIIDIVKKEKIDIIHSHHRMTTLLSKIVSKFIKVKVIHTQHVCITDKFKFTNLTLKNIPTLAVSEGTKKGLIKDAKLSEKNITTLYNGINNKYENIGVDPKILNLKEKGHFLVAQISRVVDYKGVYDFVDIAEQVVKKNDKIKFILIGDGEEYNNIDEYIKSKYLEKHVFLLGSKTNILEYLTYIDIVLLCSYVEGLPLAPIEAFSKSIPVIGTDIDGTNEEIIHGYNGYLVECKDIKSFEKYILDLYHDGKLRDLMSQNAYNSYCENFNMAKYINQHKEYYNNIICR